MTLSVDSEAVGPKALTGQEALDLARELAPKLKPFGEENRLSIALLLLEGPKNVKELQEDTGLHQTLVSHHLKILHEHKLVLVIPQGRRNFYSLCCDEFTNTARVLATVTRYVRGTNSNGNGDNEVRESG